MSDSVDQEIKEIIEARPGDWKIQLKGKLRSKQEILDSYDKDVELRKGLRQLLLGLKLHELTR